ncbi:MAG: RnfABCDGE type electron transport complex subunit D [Thiohalospira sp.]
MFELVRSSPHFHPGRSSVRRVMLTVCAALIPGTLAHLWFFGPGIAFNLTAAVAAALVTEAALLRLRHREVMPFLGDGSAVLTAWLLALALPSLAPWWLPVLGTALGMALGKHLYGGLGHNPFNPAMVGYVILLVSFPQEVTTWLPPAGAVDLGAHLQFFLTGSLPGTADLDAVTRATPLDQIKTALGQNRTIPEVWQENPIFGDLAGIGWEWVNTLFLLGGLWLVFRGTVPWQTPAGVILGVGIPALLFYAIDPGAYGSPAFHILSGATILGAFFIATDPVSAPSAPLARLWYGLGIGAFIYIIRAWGGYPDGVAFAVLLMNTAAPTLDYYIQPRTFGHGSGK